MCPKSPPEFDFDAVASESCMYGVVFGGLEFDI